MSRTVQEIMTTRVIWVYPDDYSVVEGPVS
jgi:hypothetical protein